MSKKGFLIVLTFLFITSSPAFAQQANKDKSHPQKFADPITGMQFVLVKGGCFEMGDTFGDGYRNEKPVHEVCLNDFYIGEYMVTQSEWEAVMGSNPSNKFAFGGNWPVVNVSWDDTQAFIKLLSQQSGSEYRLLTEAEWEYAARSGGKKENWAGTSAISELQEYAWYYMGDAPQQIHPVGHKKPNGLGLYDMSGNAWEWLSDRYDNTYYRISPRDNPQGPLKGSLHVLRGGSFRHVPLLLRTTYRANGEPGPDGKRYDIGFRLAKNTWSMDTYLRNGTPSNKANRTDAPAVAHRSFDFDIIATSITGKLFIASFFIAAFGWFIGIIEVIVTIPMNEFFFRLGMKAVRFQEKAAFFDEHVVINRLFETESGSFKFVNSRRCIFRQNIAWFSLGWNTPFPLKGCVDFENGVANIVGKTPLGSTIFFSAWLFAWTIGAIGYAIQEWSFTLSVIMLIFGWGFAALIYFGSIAIEKKRFLILYDEVKRHLR